MRLRSAAGLWIAVAVWAPPILSQTASIRIEAATGEVELGQAFPLTVTRSWPEGMQAEEWSPQSLAPLTLRLREHRAETRDDQVVETWSYTAHAFVREDFTIAPIRLRATPSDGGDPLLAESDALEFRVRGLIEADQVRGADFPSGVFSAPSVEAPSGLGAGQVALIAALAAAGGFTLVQMLRRHRRAESPIQVARRRLDTLAAGLERTQQADHRTDQDFHHRVGKTLRGYLGARFGYRAPSMTTEELLGSETTSSRVAPDGQEQLSTVLGRCDRILYAKDESDAAQKRALLESSQQFLQDTEAAQP